MSCGIYKIVSPSGKTYVGQSINIEKRKLTYAKNHCKSQTKLYHSLKKYSFDNHAFEIIEECAEEMLNIRERYWQEYYDVIGLQGLNCKLTTTNEKSGKHSKETRLKQSLALKGKPLSDKTLETIRRTRKSPVMIHGTYYESVNEAIVSTGLTSNTIRDNCRSKSNDDFRFINEKDNIIRKLSNKGLKSRYKPVIIDNVEYESIGHASKMLTINRCLISIMCKNPNISNYQFKNKA